MSVATKEQILKVLKAYNPWWGTGVVNPGFTKTYRRFAYYEAMKRLEQKDLRRTIVLTGTRRVGKTTIQYQMIDRLLKKGVPPQKILFVSMDHPMLKLSGLNDLLECYHSNVYAEQDCYYFFDEIQYASDWDKWMKTIYDMQPETKMVATGSASPALMKGSSESGAGRWSVIQVPTLSFYEYCALIGARVPELALASDDLMAQQIMREDVVDKVLKRDLPALYKIRSATELERIFLYLCNVSSEIVSFSAIANDLGGVSRPTVENYVNYLESANLIYQSWPVEMGGHKILKAKPKIYIADAAIRNAVLMDDDVLTNPIELGKMVETAVYKHVAAFYYQQATRVGYYRGGKKDKEIDVVVDYPNIKKILIEVKYREQAPVPDDSMICELSDEASAAIVVTKRPDDYGTHRAPNGKELIRIPAFAFLYLLGNAERYGYRGKD